MNSKVSKILLGSTLAMGLSACEMAPTTTSQTPEGWDESAAQKIDSRIAESAEKASGAAEALAQMKAAEVEPVEDPVVQEEMSKLPPELLRPTTIEWMGPAVELVDMLAKNIGYAYSVVGTQPPVDVMVSVSSVDEPAVKVFENIGYQVSEFASVYVDPNAKRVEFRFKQNHHSKTMEKPTVRESQRQNTKNTPSVKNVKDKLGK